MGRGTSNEEVARTPSQERRREIFASPLFAFSPFLRAFHGIMSQNEAGEDLERTISQIEHDIQAIVGNGLSATYRCTTCHRLSLSHPGESVKGCRTKKISLAQYVVELTMQKNNLIDTLNKLRLNANLQTQLTTMTHKTQFRDQKIAELLDVIRANKERAMRHSAAYEEYVRDKLTKDE